MATKKSDSDWNNSDEDIDLQLTVSFEELRIKKYQYNADNALIIDSNRFFVEYPKLFLKISDMFCLHESVINNNENTNNSSLPFKNECVIRQFQSTNNFGKKPHRIHHKILIKNRKEMRASYFEKARIKYLNTKHRDNTDNTDNNTDNIENEMIEHLPEWVDELKRDCPSKQFECTQQIRRLLSIPLNPPIKIVIDSGIVPRLISFMKAEYIKYERLQFEAAWAITNIASGAAENTQYVIKHGAVPLFIDLLKSSSAELQEQAAWGLGNIAGDSVECRDIVLNHNILTHLIPIFDINMVPETLAVRRTITWTLSNLARGEPVLQIVFAKQVLEILNKMVLIKNQDDEILQDIAWGYTYLFAGYNVVVGDGYKLKTELLVYGYLREIREKELDSMVIPQDITTMLILFAPIADMYIPCNILQRLIELLSNDNAHVRHPSARAIHDILVSKTENDNIKELCLEYGILRRLVFMLKNDRIAIKTEACSLINNLIIQAKYIVIQKVIDQGIIIEIIKMLKKHENDSKQSLLIKEALYVITNVFRNGNHQQIKMMINKGIIETVGAMKKPIIHIIHCMESIINYDEKYIEKIRDCHNFINLLKTCDNQTDLSNKLIAKIEGFVVRV